MNICPVCNNYLKNAPEEHNICPCCGTQFGYTVIGPKESSIYHDELRSEWITNGAAWTSKVIAEPENFFRNKRWFCEFYDCDGEIMDCIRYNVPKICPVCRRPDWAYFQLSSPDIEELFNEDWQNS